MSRTWVYHERQEAALCGQHALNNLVQAAVFEPQGLAEIAHQLDELEMLYMAQNEEGGVRSKDYQKRLREGSGNVDEAGNFSIEVLRAALKNQYGLSLPNIMEDSVTSIARDVTEMEGFICNRQSHWFAIRLINGQFWNLNSTNDRPEPISHFRLAAEIESLQKGGYSVFCIIDPGLPPPCTAKDDTDRGLPQYWWLEDDLLLGKSDATTRATDAWKNVGGGMRLDGRSDTPSMVTEDELLQRAIELSMDTTPPIELKAEPAATDDNVVRLQFRLIDGMRSVRRFVASDSVGVLYAYVESICPSEGRVLELRAGFPPKDIAVHREKTIEAAGLAGESIQGRYL